MVELDRAEWAEKTDLFLLFMTATVGLGNVYAFPYSIYRNGFASVRAYAEGASGGQGGRQPD